MVYLLCDMDEYSRETLSTTIQYQKLWKLSTELKTSQRSDTLYSSVYLKRGKQLLDSKAVLITCDKYYTEQ